MACVPTQGFTEECDDGIGGVERGIFYITPIADIDATATTIVAGEITVLTQVALKEFFTYYMKKETANFITTMVKENGNQVYETVVTLPMQKMSALKFVEFKLVAGTPAVIITKDNNGLYWAIGLEKGADLTGSVSGTGTTMNDLNGHTLTFTARSGNAPYTVDATVVAGLTIV